jgi:methionine synthase II (cobalamin-independent)
MIIKKETKIEDLVNALPASVKYMSEKGIKCIACGEPIWGTIEEAAKEKGFVKEDIDGFVRDLNRLMDQLDN